MQISAVFSVFALLFVFHTADVFAGVGNDTISSAFGFYVQTDKDDHTGGNPKIDEDEFVFEGIIILDKSIAERDRLKVKVIGDVISSASETRLWNPQFGALQGNASGNLRISLDFGYSHEFDALNMSLHAGGSYEANVYGSALYGLSVALPLGGPNTILSLGFDGATDIFEFKFFNGINAGTSSRQSLMFNVDLMRVLSPYDLLNVNAGYVLQFGTLETTFYSVFINDVEFAERMPKWRHRGNIGGRYKHSFSTQNAIDIGYRFYADDWSVFSHTVEAKFFQYFYEKHLVIEPSARFHAQTKAFFFKREFNTEEALRTSDTDLGDFSGIVLGLKLSGIDWSWFPQWIDTLSFGGKYWFRDDGFRVFWFNLGVLSRF